MNAVVAASDASAIFPNKSMTRVRSHSQASFLEPHQMFRLQPISKKITARSFHMIDQNVVCDTGGLAHLGQRPHGAPRQPDQVWWSCAV